MPLSISSTLSLALSLLLVRFNSAATLSITSQEQYSSCVGVLGCKIDTNRVAYFAGWPDCDRLCKRVSYQGRSITLLRIDTSASDKNDISYDAWNYLLTGYHASTTATNDGTAREMEVEDVDMSECQSIIKAGDGKIPFSAPNDTFLTSCIAAGTNYVSRNYALFNIYTATCTLGLDEPCTYDANTKLTSCPSQLGLMPPLGETVQNVQVGTGHLIPAPQ